MLVIGQVGDETGETFQAWRTENPAKAWTDPDGDLGMQKERNMPQVSTIPEINQMEDDQLVYAFRGTLKSMTKYYPAKPEDPMSQSMQIATFTDGPNTITVKFRNRDQIPATWKGKVIWFAAHHGEKGWSGIKAKDNERDGKPTERILLVTKSADVGPAGTVGEGAVADEAAPEPGQTTQAPSASAQASAAAAAPATHAATAPSDSAQERKAVSILRRELAKYANAFLLVAQSANWVRNQLEGGTQPIEVTDAQFQAMCSTFFIKADRQGLIDALPVKSVLSEEFAKRTTGHAANGGETDARLAAEKAAAEAKALAEANAKAEQEARAKAEAAAAAAKKATEVREDDVPF